MTDNEGFHDISLKTPDIRQESGSPGLAPNLLTVTYNHPNDQVEIINTQPSSSSTLMSQSANRPGPQIFVKSKGPCVECAQRREAKLMQSQKTCGCCFCIDNPCRPKQMQNFGQTRANIILVGLGCLCCLCWMTACVGMNLYYYACPAKLYSVETCGSCGNTIS